MAAASGLVGRNRERHALEETLAQLDEGAGGMCLVAGEAGAGKTALIESVLASTNVRVLRGGAHATGMVPYGPFIAALRDHLRSLPDDAADRLARATPGLALVLPELGPAPPAAEAETDDLPPTIRWVFEHLARQCPTIVFLDDLQWADVATLTVLADWAAPMPGLRLLVIGAYRSEELPRQHPLRSLRAALRRAAGGTQRHVHLGPLEESDSAVLVRRVLGAGVAPEVLATVQARAQGLPFYLEELATAIAETGEHVDEATLAEVVPESVRDAVLMRVARLSEPAQVVAEVAAAGSPVPLDVLTALAGEEGAVEELFECGLLVAPVDHDGVSGEAAFRHDLVAEALYAATPWMRRRRHHAALAHVLQGRGVPAAIIAAHWNQAREPSRARPWLLAAAEEACRVHAYRDAKHALDQALAQWPAGDDTARLLVVDRLAECAERCGEIPDAARAWEEVAAARRLEGAHEALARVERRLAGVYELANDWPRALAARVMAAGEFARAGLMADAAAERLTAAAHLQSSGDLTAALQHAQKARRELDAATPPATPPSPAGPVGLLIRAIGLEGLIRAKLGEGTAGPELTRKAMDLALDSGLEDLVAEVYYFHADALEHTSDYTAALGAWADASAFCRTRGLDADAHVCLACLIPALRHTGQWNRALEVAREVLATDDAPEVARMVAAGESGLVLANRGKTAQARRHLAHAAAFSRVHEVFGLEIETSWGLARADELDGDVDSAATRLRELSDRCRAREERHYSVAALRWASSFFARHDMPGDMGCCTDTLAYIAAEIGTPEATGAVAHALGEHALVEGDPRRAADQFERALELLATVTVPPETAETQVRAGVALAAAGERGKAVERLVGAYHTARTLGARPLAAAAVRQLEALGEDVQGRLGRGATRLGDPAGLTPREREVLHLVAAGLTNRQVAGELFLSARTVDMHVRNLLAKLGCHTRTEAVRRAGELALIQTTGS